MADEQQTPVFQIQRVYLKDLSLEQPNSPGILLSQESPAVDIQLGVGAEQVVEGVVEVTVTATVTAKIQDKTLFLAEVKQAGLFEIRNIPQEQISPLVSIKGEDTAGPLAVVMLCTAAIAVATFLFARHSDRSDR